MCVASVTLTAREVAALAGISYAHMRRLISRGRAPASAQTTKRGAHIFDRAAVESWLYRRSLPSPAQG